jgi:MoaA/NifB/PqqE/SkfB family radical SAM enzyme
MGRTGGASIPPSQLIRGWGRVLTGYHPSLSVEITHDCPLHCPGCYAYNPQRLESIGSLKSVEERRGEELVQGVLEIVRRHRPLHVSIVGGEPLLRTRELDQLLPLLCEAGVAVRIVTSAVLPLPREWIPLRDVSFAVSIDGLPPEHDARRAPATYDRVLRNIEGHSITVHCLVTGQMARQPGYMEEFLWFWTRRPEAERVWFSLYTPQRGESSEETLTVEERGRVLDELAALRARFPKLELPTPIIEGYRNPPGSPRECIFARWVPAFTADLTTRITPCQLGGDPDCSRCGCMPAAGLKALGDYRLFNLLPIRSVAVASTAMGDAVRMLRGGDEGARAG